MNYQEFRQFRDRAAAETSPLRLDCMNPVKAVDFLKVKTGGGDAGAVSEEKALDVWAQAMQAEPHRGNALAAPGVRIILKDLFSLFAADKKQLWLPQDVYPVYAKMAADAGLAPQSFPTVPALDLGFLGKADANSVVLLPNPLVPLGRTLDTDETATLKSWLSASPQRRLVIDAVYTFDRRFEQDSLDLLETGQAFIAHSLSKGWLEPESLGVLLAPDSDRERIRGVLEKPSPESLTRAFNILQAQPGLPEIQQKAFTAEWQRLTPAIRRFAPDFNPPEKGYFAAVAMPAGKILQDFNTLVIPAAVFGSGNENCSVITCLHDLREFRP